MAESAARSRESRVENVPLPRVPAGIASLRRKANNHIRMNVFTDSSAEKEVLFTSVNVNIQERAQVADSANVDPRKRPKRFRYRHSSRLGVKCHRQPAAPAAPVFLLTPARHIGTAGHPEPTLREHHNVLSGCAGIATPPAQGSARDSGPQGGQIKLSNARADRQATTPPNQTDRQGKPQTAASPIGSALAPPQRWVSG
jgi:hypothetical protein